MKPKSPKRTKGKDTQTGDDAWFVRLPIKKFESKDPKIKELGKKEKALELKLQESRDPQINWNSPYIQDVFDALRDEHQKFHQEFSEMIARLISRAKDNDFWREALLEKALFLTSELNRLAADDLSSFQRLASAEKRWPIIATSDSYKAKQSKNDKIIKEFLHLLGVLPSRGKRISRETPQTRFADEMHVVISNAIRDHLRAARYRNKPTDPIETIRSGGPMKYAVLKLLNHRPLSSLNYKRSAKVAIELLPYSHPEFGGEDYENREVWEKFWHAEDGQVIAKQGTRTTAVIARKRIRKAIQKAFLSLASKPGT
jgi:hypothetical protein